MLGVSTVVGKGALVLVLGASAACGVHGLLTRRDARLGERLFLWAQSLASVWLALLGMVGV